MKIKTLIIDDEPIALEKLKTYVEKVPFLELVDACSSAFDGIKVISEKNVDVVFTDINMPDLNGVEFVESLSDAPMIVFTTAYTDYAVQSYRLSAVDYLLKPYGFADFQRAANKVLDIYNSRNNQNRSENQPAVSESIFIKVDYRYMRVELNNICYIKGFGEYLKIFVKDAADPLLTLSSFNNVLESLSENFLQVHRSYIVNMNCVNRIERGRIIIGNDTYIPVGDSYRAELQNYLQAHSIGASSKKDS